MKKTSILIFGVLVAIAVVALTYFIRSAAPAIAGAVVICVLFWLLGTADNETPPPT